MCERGFALMNNLKTARRSLMGNPLLRTLMTICELGKEWVDSSKIPVDEIADEWRGQSARGRYESAMWRAAGLEEPGTKAPAGATAFNAVQGVEGTVDNTTAGGFFQRYGREPNLPGPCVNRRTVEAPDMPDARTDSAAAAGSSGGVVAAEDSESE